MKAAKKILISMLALVLAVTLAGCSGDEDEPMAESIENYSELTQTRMCLYLTGADGEPLNNATIKVTASGEELTYTADFLGYVEVPSIKIGETVSLSVTDSSGAQAASSSLTIDIGDSFGFDDKQEQAEKITITETSSVFTAYFTVTQGGFLNCTNLS